MANPVDIDSRIVYKSAAWHVCQQEEFMRRISLEEAQDRLGKDVVIDLEPADAVATKVAAGKGDELWVFDLGSGWISRVDHKFHAAAVVRHPGGWNVAAIIEELNVPLPVSGPRIVGHVIVEMNPRGLVHVRRAKGLNGEVLELKPSSVSKGELDASGSAPNAIIEANPQRLDGSIAVYINQDVEFPDAEGMHPGQFLKESTDGRSLAAVGKLYVTA